MKLSQVLQTRGLQLTGFDWTCDPLSWIMGPKLEATGCITALKGGAHILVGEPCLQLNPRSEDMGRCRKPFSNPWECRFSMVGSVSEDSDRPGRQAFLSVLRPSLRDDRNFETLQGWSLALPRHSGSADACCRFLWAFFMHRPWFRMSISTRIHRDPLLLYNIFVLKRYSMFNAFLTACHTRKCFVVFGTFERLQQFR